MGQPRAAQVERDVRLVSMRFLLSALSRLARSEKAEWLQEVQPAIDGREGKYLRN